MIVTEHTYFYTRNLTMKVIEHYKHGAAGAMTRTLIAEPFDLPTDRAELEALHVLLGQMLQCSDDSCPCVAAGEQAQRDYRP